MEYNEAFFKLYENVFKTLMSEFSTEKTINLFKKIMANGLQKAYDSSHFLKGDPKEFARVVIERDNSVGLPVKVEVMSNSKIIYQFLRDPFPNLRDIISHDILDSTYIPFKVNYLLGNEWHYTCIKHFWNGDSLTEFFLEK